MRVRQSPRSDKELLRLALASEQLTPEANIAVTAELVSRDIPGEVHVQAAKQEEQEPNLCLSLAVVANVMAASAACDADETFIFAVNVGPLHSARLNWSSAMRECSRSDRKRSCLVDHGFEWST